MACQSDQCYGESQDGLTPVRLSGVTERVRGPDSPTGVTERADGLTVRPVLRRERRA